jgi:6-phosphogluconolactonase
MDDGARHGLETLCVEDAGHLAEEAAHLVLDAVHAAIGARGAARVILAGGSTPRALHRILAGSITRDDALRISWLFGDERWVPTDDPQSNEGMARETLLGPLDAPEATIHSWHAGSGDPVACAARYAAVRATETAAGLRPDLLLLGMGPDGHTASLFPGAVARFPDGREVPIGPGLDGAAAAVPGGRPAGHGSDDLRAPGDPPRSWRLTLCPDFLNTSRIVIFLVAGADKAAALSRARAGDPRTPAAWIRGGTTYFVATRDALGPERPDFGRRVAHA